MILKLRKYDVRILNFFKAKNSNFPENFANPSLIVFEFPDFSNFLVL